MHTTVLAAHPFRELFLHVGGQLKALVQVFLLEQGEGDIGFRTVQVEVAILLIGILLVEDGGVLHLSHLEVGLVLMLTQDISLHAHGRGTLAARRVAVDGDEHVGIVAVGDGGTLVQRHEHVTLTGIDHLDIREVLLDIVTRQQGHCQIQVFLFTDRSQSTGILAAMTGVDDHGGNLLPTLCHHSHRKKKYQQ